MGQELMTPETKRAHVDRLRADLGLSFTDARTLLENNNWIFADAKAEGLKAKQANEGRDEELPSMG